MVRKWLLVTNVKQFGGKGWLCALTLALDFTGHIFTHYFSRWQLCTDEQLMENQSSKALLTSAPKVTVEKLYMMFKKDLVFNTNVYPMWLIHPKNQYSTQKRKSFFLRHPWASKPLAGKKYGNNCTRGGRVCTVRFEGDRLHLKVRAYLLKLSLRFAPDLRAE